jgi:nucleoside-diphosphate-sugar epimerase
MKVLITGGAGFIGARLADRLATLGHEVTVFDKAPWTAPNYRSILGDVRDLEALCDAVEGMDVVYNLAAEHRDDVRPISLYDEVNVGGARNLMQAVERAGVQSVIFTSSVAVYGASSTAMNEDTPHRYINDYGRTKSLAEAEHRKWAQADPARSLVIVRPSVVFGPGNRGNVYNLLAQIASGRFVMVGDGLNRKSMAYVENIVAFLIQAHLAASGVATYNYADKPDFDMNGLVALIRRELGSGDGVGPRLPLWLARIAGAAASAFSSVSGRSLPISAVRLEKFVANTEIDASLAIRDFTPPFDLKDALVLTLSEDIVRKTPKAAAPD